MLLKSDQSEVDIDEGLSYIYINPGLETREDIFLKLDTLTEEQLQLVNALQARGMELLSLVKSLYALLTHSKMRLDN